MARHTIALTVGAAPGAFAGGRAADVLNAGTIATTQAAVDAAVAVLVADGATPTEAHVTDLDGAWTDLVADIAGIYPANADIVLSYDDATVVSLARLKQAFEVLLNIAQGGGDLTR